MDKVSKIKFLGNTVQSLGKRVRKFLKKLEIELFPLIVEISNYLEKLFFHYHGKKYVDSIPPTKFFSPDPEKRGVNQKYTHYIGKGFTCMKFKNQTTSSTVASSINS